jgi:hypothetical protein
MSTATSFSEQAPAARRDYFAGSNSGVGTGGRGGIVDAARILVRQDVCDVGDVVEKFTCALCPGNLPQRSVIVGVGPPFYIGRLQRRPCYPDPSSRANAVPP